MCVTVSGTGRAGQAVQGDGGETRGRRVQTLQDLAVLLPHRRKAAGSTDHASEGL